MPRPPANHTTHRENVCAFYHSGELFKCTTSAKKVIKEGDINCQRIVKFASTIYDPSKAKFPNAICSGHKKALYLIVALSVALIGARL